MAARPASAMPGDLSAAARGGLWNDAWWRLRRNRLAVAAPRHAGRIGAGVAARSRMQPVFAGSRRLGVESARVAARACEQTLAGHVWQWTGPVRSRVRRHPGVAAGRVACNRGQPRDRRGLGRNGRVPRRARGRLDDAHRGRALRIAVHVLRDHPDGRVRAQPVPDLHRDRRGWLAHHGPHRARAKRSRCGTGNSSRPRSCSASRPTACSRVTSCRT